MRAADVMTVNVVTVSEKMGVEDVARLLVERGISAVPVLRDGKLIGMISEGDLMRSLETDPGKARSWWLRLFSSSESGARDFLKTRTGTVADLMTRDVVTVTEDRPVPEIAQLLERKRIKRVPVVRGEAVVGIVSRSNLLQALASRTSEPTAGGDRDIREAILARLAHEGWVSHGGFNVIVNDGHVELWGWVDSKKEQDAVTAAVREVDGVRAVESHLAAIPHWQAGS